MLVMLGRAPAHEGDLMIVGFAQAVTTEVAEGVAAGEDHAVAEAALQRRPFHSRLDAMHAASSHVWNVLAFCIYSGELSQYLLYYERGIPT